VVAARISPVAQTTIVPAYHPLPATDAKCSECRETCARGLAVCSAGAIIFPPALVGCVTASGACIAACEAPWVSECCPTPCQVTPFSSQHDCCDWGEHCVDQSDPNSRSGCCPRHQAVCGNKCCRPDENCCGDTCCPANYHCSNGFCTEFAAAPFGPATPPPPLPPPPAAPITCPSGYETCHVSGDHWSCCPPGKECCGPRGCQGTCVA